MNNLLMSFTAETSHDPIGPYRPLEQSVNSSKQSLMVALSTALDSGDHAMVIKGLYDCGYE